MSTLKVDTIHKRMGTGTITVGQSGDTVALPSATLTTALPVASGGTGGTSFSAAGLTNTPSFMARIGSDQGSVGSGTLTKLNYDTEIFDSDGTYDTSNKRFTPGVVGKYFCTYAFRTLDELDDGEYAQGYFYKNGSAISPDMGFMRSYSPASNQVVTVGNSMIIELDADDYVEIYMLHNEGTSISINDKSSHFSAYRILGA